MEYWVILREYAEYRVVIYSIPIILLDPPTIKHRSLWELKSQSLLTFTYSKLTTETLETGMKYVEK